MTGHIRQRGEGTWELKFDIGRDEKTGKRITQFHSFKGTKKEAKLKLIELIDSVAKGSYVRRLAPDYRRTCCLPHRSMGGARKDHTENRGAIPRVACQSDSAAYRTETAPEIETRRHRSMARHTKDYWPKGWPGRSEHAHHSPCSSPTLQGTQGGYEARFNRAERCRR